VALIDITWQHIDRIDGIVIRRVIGADVAAAAADQSTIMPMLSRFRDPRIDDQ